MAELCAASAASSPGAPAGPRGDPGASTSTNNDARLQLVGPALKGKTKWLGAALVDGTLLGIPGHATSILRIDPRLDRVSVLGEGCVNKRGVRLRLPAHAGSVLRVDAATGTSLLPLRAEQFNGGKYKWGGGCANGCVYAVPSDASRVLKVNCATGAVSLFGDLPRRRNKWQGGVLGDGGSAGGRRSRPLRAAAKILTAPRRHCLELNGLFSEFLARLGFECKLLPCRVYAGRGGAGFRHVPSRAAVVARPSGDAYFVDVGLGEPPLAAVPFAPSGDAVETPEGMASPAPLGRGARRLGHHGPSLAEFEAEAARYARQPGRKFVCSKVTRHRKTTIRASLKVTAPRFGPASSSTSSTSAPGGRRALEAHFGVPYAETAGLDVARRGRTWP
ncbi:hypothetical protein JL721_2465 [Aureococcus anophagefferens]|nr:hypothetical protein JL721_2465 [Aureococcus anophagefferens]